MIPLGRRGVMGPFERFLLRSPPKLVRELVTRMDLADIVRLGRLNIRMRHWYDAYRRRNWDVLSFLSLYVGRYEHLLSYMDGRNALMYGEAVLRFLLQCGTSDCPLDICTTLKSFYEIERLLCEDGYSRRRRMMEQTTHEEVSEIVRLAHLVDTESWSLDGDRSVDPVNHLGFKFEFVKQREGRRKDIHLHLIRCEPYRHVLASPITPLTCYITADHVVAPFAYTTFQKQVAFALPNHSIRDFGSTITERGGLFQVKGTRHRFDVAYGPPLSFREVHAAETGFRSMGDGSCLVFHRNRTDPMLATPAVKGPAFEVIDHTMIEDDSGAYMQIGEPFVLSSRYYYSIQKARKGRLDKLRRMIRY